MSYFALRDHGLLVKRRKELLWIVPWGDGLRVRATENADFTAEDWALLPAPAPEAVVTLGDGVATVENGKLRAEVTEYGKIKFFNRKGELILNEYYRSWDRGVDFKKDLDQITMVRAVARTFKGVPGDNYRLTARFEAADDEHFYGMGQYQHPYLDLKGCSLELAQRNTQASVPFTLSSKGYGFLWNNPAVGRATFAKNLTEWGVASTRQMDYWIVAGDSPAEIEEAYARVTGTVPMMPAFAMGFWQCKLRYQTQEELLTVAREYHRRRIPVKVIVIDFFHWPHQGDWTFDPLYWPDPEGMIAELNAMGMKLMVSVWPTVDRESVHYQEMMERDLLVRVDRGNSYTMECFGAEAFFDATNPESRRFVWDACRRNYFDKGVSLFWLDEAEPEYTAADFDIYRYKAGSALETANVYPAMYAKAFYDGMREAGVENPINLIRCAWAGSQRYGALAWSGDVPSTFTQLRNQFTAGLNMGLAGMPWWTADIGGFHGGDIRDPAFRELLVRWFQFGAFCPVMRLHGDREPHTAPLGTTGGGMCPSGAPNEVWSYGPEAEHILTRYIRVREAILPYITDAMREAHEKGTPVIKPLFYDFPADSAAWTAKDAYLFGHDVLVAPVMEAGAREREVYLPAGARWTDVSTGETLEGGRAVTAAAPLDVIPLFVREGAAVLAQLRQTE